jgi:hypothetical protein
MIVDTTTTKRLEREAKPRRLAAEQLPPIAEKSRRFYTSYRSYKSYRSYRSHDSHNFQKLLQISAPSWRGAIINSEPRN